MTNGGCTVNQPRPDNLRPSRDKAKETIAQRSSRRASSSWWKPVAFTLVFCALIVCALMVALAALPGVGPSMRAQEPAATIAVDVKVVTLPVTVRDKHGKIVRDLTKDDFTLQEDGRPQTIKYFSQETNLPLTLGLLVDTSRSQDNVLDAERSASRSFLDQMLVQPKDKAFLIHFDREVELLQDLTPSREKLQAALDLLKTSSDGVDHGSKTYLESAIESAQRSDTVVYSIYFADSHRNDRENQGGGMGRGGGYPGGGGGGWPGGGGGWPGGGGGGRGGRGGQRPSESPRTDGKKILERISKETGGRFFEVTKKETVGDIYTSIVEELRTQYSMGYTPDKDSAANGYHHVVLAVKKKDLSVQTRDGYYADR